MTMIDRLRERASYLSARTQSAIAWGFAVVVFVLASIVEDSLDGPAATAFWLLTAFLFGVAAALMWVERRR